MYSVNTCPFSLDLCQLGLVLRPYGGDALQYRVVSHHKGGDAAGLGRLTAPGAQLLEQPFVHRPNLLGVGVSGRQDMGWSRLNCRREEPEATTLARQGTARRPRC
jgi:hypothetical protein